MNDNGSVPFQSHYMPNTAAQRAEMLEGLGLNSIDGLFVALLGDEVVNCTYGATQAGRLTYGHRSLHPEPITLTSPDLSTYIEKLRAVGVVVCPKERRNTIEKQVRDVLEVEGCLPKLDEELLDTVNYLVENPQPIVGNFSESHLEIPSEVLITAMKTHQRYFSDVGK